MRLACAGECDQPGGGEHHQQVQRQQPGGPARDVVPARQENPPHTLQAVPLPRAPHLHQSVPGGLLDEQV